MRPYCAIYVDAGYLYAASATRVTGTSLRSGVRVDPKELIERLIAQAEADSRLPLLRVNWYDSGGRTGGMPDFRQEEIGLLPRVKLRLGRLSRTGEQKGVDLRIGLDLATHSRHRVADVVYLVSGDDDLTEAVEEAQNHGAQVILLAVPGANGRPHAVARHLQREADGLVLIDQATIDDTVKPAGHPPEVLPDGMPDDSNQPSADAAGIPIPDSADPTRAPSPEGESAGGTSGDVPGSEAQPVRAADPLTDVDDGEAEESRTPTPSIFAARRSTTVVAPTFVPARHETSGRAATDPHTALVDEVVSRVVSSWCQTATVDDVVALRDQKPFIPGDIDRTLLADLASHRDDDDIDDVTRHIVRDRFWDFVERIRMR
ncbi:MAG: NYN domain-containing protein [Nostocoides sp.]